MSQATTTVENAIPKTVRLGFNAAIQAVQSMFYGSGDPLTLGYSVAEMIWIDSDNNLVKQMNSDNTAWVTIGTIASDGHIIWTNTNALPLAGGTMTGALHQPNPVSLTSSSGVVTLTSSSNSFIVSGTEAVTKITGWTAGIVVIRWNTARTLTYNATSLILQNSQSRTTAAGDIGIYEMTSAGAREMNYFAASTSTDMSAFPLGLGNYIASGMKMSSIASLVATLASGTVVIDNMPVSIGSAAVTLPVRKANLIYASADQSLGYVSAAIPTSYIDNNTVGFWVFNQTTSGAVIPNSAVGVSSIAVENNFTPAGGIAAVDGWIDYAMKADGSSGYYVSDNYTNFPSGAAVREIDLLYTYKSTGGYLFGYGSAANLCQFSVIATSDVVCLDLYGTSVSTGFTLNSGQTYLFNFLYDGSYLYFYVNGSLVYKYAATLTTTAAVLYIFRRSSATYNNGTMHYLELRTKMRSAAQLGAMANSLLLPCFYDKNSATAPTVPRSYASNYHEYLFADTSTTVADSNTTTTLTGTATNTTAVQTSDIGLTYSRLFSAGYVSVGSFAVASTFTYIGVVKIDSYATARCLWSNRPSGGTGIRLYINLSGYLVYTSGTTDTVLTSTAITTGKAVFIAVTINGTTATVYIDSGQKLLAAVVTTPSTTSAATYIGYDVYSNLYMTGKYDYCMFVNAELSQAEIDYYYTCLMATGRRSIIDDVLPTSSVALAFTRTNSSKIIEYNDTDYQFGRREKAVGGNRKVFLGWKYFSGAGALTWQNPFGTRKVEIDYVWAQDANGTNECNVANAYYSSTSYGAWLGCHVGQTPSQRISCYVTTGGATSFNGAWQTTGYIGCYAQVLEDYEGV